MERIMKTNTFTDTHVTPAHSGPVNAKSHSDSTAVRYIILAYVHLHDATHRRRVQSRRMETRSRACKSALRNFDLSLEDERRERERKTRRSSNSNSSRAGLDHA
uniref:Uncharacterized protein n=1 Tax=Trichogramma kaykai TaxID=54128 RepID=A0ABD2WS87_9HYME